MVSCPNCQSERTRRGGNRTWIVYVVLIATGLTAALIFHLNAAIVAGIMLAAIVITNLVINERIFLDCGYQWRAK